MGPNLAGSTTQESTSNTVPVTARAGLNLALLITTLVKAQPNAQLAQIKANHSNLIAFQTATA
jgi:hypothetical protein